MKNSINNFEFALEEVLNIEGGYVDDSNDNGGKTNYGITEYTAKQNGYDINSLTKENAIDIYKKSFWDKYNLELLNNKYISKEVFEFGVNSGMKIAIKVLQRTYNVLSKTDLIKEDGLLGNITASKINNYKHINSFIKIQNILQGMFYIGLAEGDKELLNNIKHHKESSNKQYKTFIRGWINKRIEI